MILNPGTPQFFLCMDVDMNMDMAISICVVNMVQQLYDHNIIYSMPFGGPRMRGRMKPGEGKTSN